MNVQDIYTPWARSCQSDQSLAEAARIMRDHDCGDLPVVDGEGRLVGMITDRGICMCMALATRVRLASKVRVGEVMSGNVPTCGLEDNLRRVVDIMRQEQLPRLPVVDSNGVLCGTVTVNDVIRAVEKTRGSKLAAVTYDDVILTMMAISVPEGAPRPKAAKAS